MLRLLLLASISFFAFPVLLAQTALPDSIEQQLSTLKPDTAKLNFLFDLSGKAHRYDTQLNKAVLDRAKVISEELNAPIYMAKTMVKLGIHYTYQNKYTVADSLYDRALTLYRAEGDSAGQTITLSEKGILNYYRMDDLNAIKNFLEAYELSVRLNDLKMQAYIANNLCSVYSALGDLENALVFGLKAMKIKKDRNDPRLSSSYLNIGYLYFKLSKVDSAMHYLHRSRNLKMQSNDLRGLSACYNHLADIYSLLKIRDSAFHYYQSAIAINIELGDSVALLKDLYSKGEAHLSFDEGKSAIAALNRAMGISQNEAQKERGYLLLADAYKLQEDFKKANRMLRKYVAVRDSVHTAEKDKTIEGLKAKFENEQKEREIKLLKAENELSASTVQQQERMIWFTVIVLLLLIAFGSFYFFTHRQKFKLQEELLQAEIEKLRANIQLLTGEESKSEEDLKMLNAKLENQLTEREMEVLSLAFENNTNQQIADLIHVSLSTVKFHFTNIYQKLEVKNRKEAIIKITNQ